MMKWLRAVREFCRGWNDDWHDRFWHPGPSQDPQDEIGDKRWLHSYEVLLTCVG
jgi:hypothetical protein